MSNHGTDLTLSETCAAFAAALADYNQNAPEDTEAGDAYAEVTFVPWIERLEEWDRPAETHEDAVAALRVALREAEQFYSSTPVVPMIRAAFTYLDSGVSGTEAST